MPIHKISVRVHFGGVVVITMLFLCGIFLLNLPEFHVLGRHPQCTLQCIQYRERGYPGGGRVRQRQRLVLLCPPEEPGTRGRNRRYVLLTTLQIMMTMIITLMILTNALFRPSIASSHWVTLLCPDQPPSDLVTLHGHDADWRPPQNVLV